MKSLRSLPSLLLITALSFFLTQAAFAGSATWNLGPASDDWNTATNWTPATVPNGPTDIATFAASSITDLTFSAEMTEVAAIVFNPGASSFNITADPDVTLSISGPGITNDSGVMQNLTVAPSVGGHSGIIEFVNTASAGDGTVLTVFGSETSGAVGGGNLNFHDASTSGAATIVAEGALAGNEAHGGEVTFDGNATAGNASVTIDGALSRPGFAFGGEVVFAEFSSANDAVFVINSGTGANGGAGTMLFADDATAANGIFTLNGPTTSFAETANIILSDGATAGNGFFTVNGGPQPDTSGGSVIFEGFTFTGQIVSAGTATFINNGGNGANSFGGSTSFISFGGPAAATASQALLVANGGENGGGGGTIRFSGGADGGEARVEVFGNGTLDIADITNVFVSVGSIEGDGLVELGTNQLITGANGLSTTFSGLIEDPGSLAKIGTGMLTLSGANTYTRGTVVNEGTLRVANTSGSGTGTRDVEVNGGILGGNGIIAGSVTVGTGSGTGAFLAPGAGATNTSTLTIQRALTIKADGTYRYRLKTKRAEADQVIANGVTIESGAQFSFRQLANKQLIAGTVFTAIDNTSTNPIAGTFANLPDDSIFTVGNNTYQADYQGGDGNDLTLTLIP
jgi:autotransporter-associated beta strand protein